VAGPLLRLRIVFSAKSRRTVGRTTRPFSTRPTGCKKGQGQQSQTNGRTNETKRGQRANGRLVGGHRPLGRFLERRKRTLGQDKTRRAGLCFVALLLSASSRLSVVSAFSQPSLSHRKGAGSASVFLFAPFYFIDIDSLSTRHIRRIRCIPPAHSALHFRAQLHALPRSFSTLFLALPSLSPLPGTTNRRYPWPTLGLAFAPRLGYPLGLDFAPRLGYPPGLTIQVRMHYIDGALGSTLFLALCLICQSRRVPGTPWPPQTTFPSTTPTTSNWTLSLLLFLLFLLP